MKIINILMILKIMRLLFIKKMKIYIKIIKVKMKNNCWIKNDWLIFKPEFNEVLTKYYDVINKYKKYCKNYFINKFSKKIDLSNNINLTHLTFGECFNQKIDLLNNINLIHLTFGYNFNKEIDLSKNINNKIDSLINKTKKIKLIESIVNIDKINDCIKNKN